MKIYVTAKREERGEGEVYSKSIAFLKILVLLSTNAFVVFIMVVDMFDVVDIFEFTMFDIVDGEGELTRRWGVLSRGG